MAAQRMDKTSCYGYNLPFTKFLNASIFFLLENTIDWLRTIQIQEILFHSIIHNWIFNFVSLHNRNFAASNNHLILYCALIILHSKLLITANVKLVVIYMRHTCLHQIKIVPDKFHGFPFKFIMSVHLIPADYHLND